MIGELLVGGIVVYAIMKKNSQSGTGPIASGGGLTPPIWAGPELGPPIRPRHPYDPPVPGPMKRGADAMLARDLEISQNWARLANRQNTGDASWTVDPATGQIGFNKNVINCGGGGPENRGAKSANQLTTKLPTTQPSWFYESEDEYFGPAVKSTTPITAGGGLGQPRDAFRWLGDNFDARQ